ncbi:hypothetical protein [Noviherbaspirillum pedocola]|uniref:Uncharacterized protein n=1 Tax=Noviherbaspirillum pedocola TaxID=2801341 RepID=A0A934W890_9BURK|nr:hypothetical protein [Noviherbaspirillum pedocola]MBK4737290.1 hypothetical protein [Noviherbaspirillum pedocola]
MKRDGFELLNFEGKSEEQISKIKLILDFMERLPTDALREELCDLMEKQPSMALGEFDARLREFSKRVHAVLSSDAIDPYRAGYSPKRLH